MIAGVTDIGSLPALEQTLKFTGARHRLILHNIANLDTPNYQPRDVDPRGFQAMLAEALQERRSAGAVNGPLHFRKTREISFDETGKMNLDPRTPSGNILFHDRNDRDLERTMQSLAENGFMFRASAELLRSRYSIIDTAIRERV